MNKKLILFLIIIFVNIFIIYFIFLYLNKNLVNSNIQNDLETKKTIELAEKVKIEEEKKEIKNNSLANQNLVNYNIQNNLKARVIEGEIDHIENLIEEEIENLIEEEIEEEIENLIEKEIEEEIENLIEKEFEEEFEEEIENLIEEEIENNALANDVLLKSSLSALKTDAFVATASNNTTIDICNAVRSSSIAYFNSANYPKSECVQESNNHAVNWAVVVELQSNSNRGGKNYYCIDGSGFTSLKSSYSVRLTSTTAYGDIGFNGNSNFFVYEYRCK